MVLKSGLLIMWPFWLEASETNSHKNGNLLRLIHNFIFRFAISKNYNKLVNIVVRILQRKRKKLFHGKQLCTQLKRLNKNSDLNGIRTHDLCGAVFDMFVFPAPFVVG